MPNVGELLNVLDSIAPFSLAMGFDNPGLIVGDREAEVQGILLAVDVTPTVIGEAAEKGANVIISHHPLMFSPIKHLVEQEGEGALLRELIRKGINLIVMHTNYDVEKNGVNRALADRIGLTEVIPLEGDGQRDVLIRAKTNPPFVRMPKDCWNEGEWQCGVFSGIDAKQVLAGLNREGVPHYEEDLLSEGEFGYGLVGEIPEQRISELAHWLKERLEATCIKYTGEKDRRIHRLAVACGSGKSVFSAALSMGAQAVVTGECTYDVALLYTHLGLCVFEAGHFDTEKWFMESLGGRLQNELVQLQWNVRMLISGMSKDVYSGAI